MGGKRGVFFTTMQADLAHFPNQQGQTIIREMYEVAKGMLPLDPSRLSPPTAKRVLNSRFWLTDDLKELRPIVRELLLQSCELNADGIIRLVDPWKDTEANGQVLRRVQSHERELADELLHGLLDNDAPRWERN